MANEPEAGKSAGKTAANRSGRRSRHLAGCSFRPPGSAAEHAAPGRPTWREYGLQLLVVILGIVVTLAGSEQRGRARKSRKLWQKTTAYD